MVNFQLLLVNFTMESLIWVRENAIAYNYNTFKKLERSCQLIFRLGISLLALELKFERFFGTDIFQIYSLDA